jgi:hypothetical protein
MKYQGYAVTHVDSVTHGSEQVHRLRVDRDDIPTDYESYFLIYDKNWNLLNDLKMAEPIRPHQEPADSKPKNDKPSPDRRAPERKPTESIETDQPRRETGTSGSGSDDPAPDPEEPVEEPPQQSRDRH